MRRSATAWLGLRYRQPAHRVMITARMHMTALLASGSYSVCSSHRMQQATDCIGSMPVCTQLGLLGKQSPGCKQGHLPRQDYAHAAFEGRPLDCSAAAVWQPTQMHVQRTLVGVAAWLACCAKRTALSEAYQLHSRSPVEILQQQWPSLLGSCCHGAIPEKEHGI